MKELRRRQIILRSLGCASLAAAASLLVWSYAATHWLIQGPYRIGWEPDPPEQVLGANGEPTGVAIEVVREAARRRGIALQWVKSSQSSQASLLTGKVDLWPLMTITPERRKLLHISSPYLDSGVSFLVLRDGPFHKLEDLSHETVGYLPLPERLRLAGKYLPNAQLAARKNARILVQSLCDHEFSAALVEQDELIQNLMRGGQFCSGQAFAMIAAPGATIGLGVGSTFAAAPAADAIREEIDAMSAEGRLQELFAQWGYLSGRNASSVAALLMARQRERSTQAVAALFGLLFLLALWHTLRYRRESNRARSAEAALRKSISDSQQMQERLRLLAHALWSANDCISITDPENRLLYVNQAFLRTYEYSELELLGHNIEMVRSSNPNLAPDRDAAAAIVGESWRGELWNRTKTGREFPISLATSHVKDDTGNFIAMVAVASDITERKLAEDEHRYLQEQYLQAQKLEGIGRLAGGVAHDFNNLLTIINGYCELILASLPANDKTATQVCQIHRAGERAAALTQQLLAFSRKQIARSELVDLNSLVLESKDMFQRLLGEDIRFELQLAPGSCPVLADSGQVHQILMNLLVNSRDAMPNGGELRIATATVINPPGFGLLTVSDTGTGIDAETQRHIFEPFYSTKPIGKGTGLGLSTVYGIVQQNKGRIEVSSEPGRGTSFRVYLQGAPQPQAVRSTTPESTASPSESGSTVLVVEDQAPVRDFVCGVLKSSGYHVIPAADAPTAIALANAHNGPLHIVLTDVVMPGMNGCDLIEKLKVVRPGIQAVLMSGYSEEVIAERGALNSGIAHIAKPFTPKQLVAILGELSAAAAKL